MDKSDTICMQQEIHIKDKQHHLWLGNRSARSVKDCVVYQGDNLEILKELESGKVDFIYIDPPFCSQVVQKSKAWNKQIVSFNDEWGGGVHSYIRWLVPRLKECHRILKDTGVFCLHLDDKACHYTKIELDKIFGYKNLINQDHLGIQPGDKKPALKSFYPTMTHF